MASRPAINAASESGLGSTNSSCQANEPHSPLHQHSTAMLGITTNACIWQQSECTQAQQPKQSYVYTLGSGMCGKQFTETRAEDMGSNRVSYIGIWRIVARSCAFVQPALRAECAKSGSSFHLWLQAVRNRRSRLSSLWLSACVETAASISADMLPKSELALLIC